MPTKRKLKLTAPTRRVAKERHNNGELTAGGSVIPIGHTADLSGLTRVGKNLYGLFGESTPYVEVSLKEGDSPALLEPPLAYRDLMKVYLQSTILRQCVESYTVNIESFGHVLEYIGPTGKQDSLAARNEHARLSRVIDNITTDGRPLQTHREDARKDFEIMGARAFEVGEDAAGRTTMFNHVPTHTLRMTQREKEYTPVEMINPMTGGTYMVLRRFRRFLQINDKGEKVWFKEYGDPRSMDPATGKFGPLAIEDQATSIYYQPLYTPGTPYGMPRWSGVIPALLGSREAEMVNLNFFRDNAIPAMAVLVSGGALSAESFDKIEQYIAGVRGQKSMNRIVVLEASASDADVLSTDGSLPSPKVDIKPMLSERQHEGLFANYINAAEEKVLSSFRLPPVYVGKAKEYNRASAFAAMLVADQQIFTPERTSWDTMFQTIVLSTHNPKFWRYRSVGPALSDPQEVTKVVDSLAREGGLTPNVAIKLANRYLDADVAPVMEEWGNVPFAVILQLVKAGNKIKGLDTFISEAAQIAAKPPANANDNDEENDEAVAKVRKSLHSLFEELSEDLKGQVPAMFERAIIDYKQAS